MHLSLKAIPLGIVDITGWIAYTGHDISKTYQQFYLRHVKLKMNEKNKITIDVFSKPTNSFTYVMLNSK